MQRRNHESERLTMTAETPAPSTKSSIPTGAEFLESLRDGRNVWIYGERVDDVTTHPAFRNSARSLARLYDAMHDPASASIMQSPTDTGSGGVTHPFFKVARTTDDLRAGRDAVAHWQQLVFGWMGRTPDYKASLITTLGDNPEYFGEYADNARHWYRVVQENVTHIGHAIVNPPVDRALPVTQSKDVFVRVLRETDEGIIVSGAKVVATGSPTTQYVYVSKSGGAPITEKSMALTFIAPASGKGIHMISRASYEGVAAAAASPMDYPLSSRLDENDAILVFDEALIPWENVLIYDTERVNEFDDVSGWLGRATFQSATRMGVKLDFILGAVREALEITGAGGFRGVQAGVGEIVAFRHAVNAIRDGMIENAEQGWSEGTLVPNQAYGFAYAALAPGLYRRMREIIETIVASGLIYLNSNAVDFQTPQIRTYLDTYLRGTGGKTALDRSKTMKLLWDAIGSEFGARHELYELNYFGQPEVNHLVLNQVSQEDGTFDHARDLVTSCMKEYDLSGWSKESEFINPDDIGVWGRK